MRNGNTPVLLSLGLLAWLLSLPAAAALPAESETVVPFKILHTGNTQSALEVCGCPSGLQGGVAPRAHIIQQERAGVERCLLLDSGGLFSGEEPIDQERIQLYLQTMALMGYDAVLISESEFCFGPEFLIEQLQRGLFPALATNLSAPADTLQPWEPVLFFEFPRLRIALIGLLQGDPQRIPASYTVSDPIEAASRAVEAIGDAADMIVALSTLDKEPERQLLKEVPAIDLVLSGRSGMPFQKFFGTLVAHASEVGKTVNVIEAAFFPSEEQYPFSLRPRSRQVVPKQGVDPVVRQVVDEFYESIRRRASEQGAELRLFADESVENLPGNAFLGSIACKECHPFEYNHWQQTRHASSMLSLLNKHRHFVPECLRCHTTGYAYLSGFNQFADDSPLGHVGCESCHGPGKIHAEEPTRKGAMRRPIPDEHCKSCHDADNDPEFDNLADIRRLGVKHINLGIMGTEPR